MDKGVINIGSQRECFFDDYLIDTEKTTAEFLLHHPVRREKVMTMDGPWEGNGSTHQHLVKAGDWWRLYYIGRSMEPVITGAEDKNYVFCCAESKDGLHWVRPALQMYEFNGDSENNIISSRSQAGHGPLNVFYDENPACPPTERYKTIVCQNLPNYNARLIAIPSPDGIHFDYDKVTVLEEGGFYDSMICCFWDHTAQKYRLYFRGYHLMEEYKDKFTSARYPDSHLYRLRDIRYMESPDFVHWSSSRMIDQGDAEDIELYENKIQPYYRAPHMLIGFPTRYMGRRKWTSNYDELCDRENRQRRFNREERFGLAVTDCTFMTSRDGVKFCRYDEAFIRPGPENGTNWAYGFGYPAYGLLETPSDVPGEENEISLLVPEGMWTKDIDLIRYTIRLDGFASLHAKKEETVVSKPFIFDGEELYANISTSAMGYLYFALTAEDGTAIHSCEIFGDSTDRRITFDDGVVAAFSGKPVVLTVKMRDADLYAIRFGEKK